MTSARISKGAAIVALAATGIVGIYGALFVGFNNGFLPAITKGLERSEVPGCPAPFKTTYTGFTPIDVYLQNVVPFFCIAIDGKQTWDTTLSNWYLSAQLCAAWTLVCLEGLRRGNKGKVAGW